MAREKRTIIKTIGSCNQGVALLEFALILPVLLLLVFGGIEITRLVLFHQKIDNATSGVANVITQLDYNEVPCEELRWQRETLIVEAMRPFNFNNGGSMIISAVEASDPDPNNPDDSKPLLQRVIWQWSPDSAASRIATEGSLATGSGWPTAFSRSPDAGGMVNGERVIAVETFYSYQPAIPLLYSMFKWDIENSVSKSAFFRSRFGKMGSKQAGC